MIIQQCRKATSVRKLPVSVRFVLGLVYALIIFRVTMIGIGMAADAIRRISSPRTIDYIVYAIILIAVPVIATEWVRASIRERTCRSCGERALKQVNWIRATVLIDGRRAPDSWTCYCCQSCGARYRRKISGEWILVPPDVQDDHFTPQIPVPRNVRRQPDGLP